MQLTRYSIIVVDQRQYVAIAFRGWTFTRDEDRLLYHVCFAREVDLCRACCNIDIAREL